MVKHCDFLEQASLSGEEVLRPDAIVRMPGGKHVMMDAKAPLQGVLDAWARRRGGAPATPTRSRSAAASSTSALWPRRPTGTSLTRPPTSS